MTRCQLVLQERNWKSSQTVWLHVLWEQATTHNAQGKAVFSEGEPKTCKIWNSNKIKLLKKKEA